MSAARPRMDSFETSNRTGSERVMWVIIASVGLCSHCIGGDFAASESPKRDECLRPSWVVTRGGLINGSVRATFLRGVGREVLKAGHPETG